MSASADRDSVALERLAAALERVQGRAVGGGGSSLPCVRTPPADPSIDRSDETLRVFADFLLEAATAARRNAGTTVMGDVEPAYVVVQLSDGSGVEPMPWRWSADTIDEVGRVLGALPQIRRGR